MRTRERLVVPISMDLVFGDLKEWSFEHQREALGFDFENFIIADIKGSCLDASSPTKRFLTSSNSVSGL